MMATAAAPRKVSIYDYPEHLNPFREEDDHKSKFWTLGRKLTRSNSITFSGFKDLRNSWLPYSFREPLLAPGYPAKYKVFLTSRRFLEATPNKWPALLRALRSFMKKGKKDDSSATKKRSSQVNGDSSPIVYRRGAQYSSISTLGTPAATPSDARAESYRPQDFRIRAQSSLGSPERPDRYVYGGSVTPLPRSRFQERLRSPNDVNSQRPVTMDQNMTSTPRMARSDITGSRLSVESTNPFDECPVPPVRASRRKKKRAPPPPHSANTSLVSSTQLDSSAVSEQNETKRNSDMDVEDASLNIELKIVEDDDAKETKKVPEQIKKCESASSTKDTTEVPKEKEVSPNINKPESRIEVEDTKIEPDSTQDDDSFQKINIVKYRRNSSLNEDDIRRSRGNSEFQAITTRSKSLSNAIGSVNNNYVKYDINLNSDNVDSNGNTKKVVCKYNETARKHSIETVSSTEKEFQEIDRATKELEQEINRLNLALKEDEPNVSSARLSVTEIKKKFNGVDVNFPNPIPKPKRTNSSPNSVMNGKITT